MHTLTDAGEARLETFFEDLGDQRRKASFATYALGLLGEGERKIVEPIADVVHELLRDGLIIIDRAPASAG